MAAEFDFCGRRNNDATEGAMNFPPEHMTRLYDSVRAIHSTLEPEAALRLVVREAVSLVGASSGSLVLLNPNTGLLETEVAEGLPEADPALRLEAGVAGWVVRHGESLRVGDAAGDERCAGARPGVHSELAVPLRMEGSVRSVLRVDATEADAFSETDQALLEELAVHATQVIHNTWLYEQLRQRTELLESLVSVGQTINRTLNLDDVLEAITREAAGLGRARACSLQLLDASGEWLEVRAQYGAGSDYQQRPALSVAESLMGAVVRRRKPVQVGDLLTSAQYQHAEIARREGFISLLSVPLVYSEDCLGTLNIYTDAPHVFSNEEMNTLAALAELSAVAIEKARLYERTVDVEEQLRRNEQLSALGLLAAEVAHEIRNPLTVMKMLYHSLDLKFPDDDPRREDARVLAEKMIHLDRIVDNIVNFARNAEPRMAPVHVPTLLDDLALLTRHKLQHHSIHLERDDAPELPPVKADATQLSQAFLNVILNATEAMPEGGTLRIATAREGNELRVSFADTGPGMTDAQRERAFTGMLSTTKEKGGGLGLAIVAKVAEAHGGRVELESKEGRGTEITLCLASSPESTQR
jgi:signal transduction histidine kinase